jgi:hypothetical protein
MNNHQVLYTHAAYPVPSEFVEGARAARAAQYGESSEIVFEAFMNEEAIFKKFVLALAAASDES